jgi:hypothetical protein
MRLLALLVCFFLISCSSDTEYSTAEDFVRGFLNSLISNQNANFAEFYFQNEDFANNEIGNELKTRLMERPRKQFISSAGRIAGQLQGKKVVIESVVISEQPTPLTMAVVDVKASHAQATAHLTVDDQKWVITVSDIVKTGSNWRLSGFFTTVDLGTETRDMVEIELPVEEESEGITEEK